MIAELSKVALRLVPIGKPDDISKFQLINEKRKNAVLGILSMMGEERTFVAEHIYPSEDQTQYRSYLYARLTNPMAYSVDGKKLGTYTMRQQLDFINQSWQSVKNPPNTWTPQAPHGMSLILPD
jgi:hypothetical protein